MVIGTRQGCIRFKIVVQTSANYIVCIWCKVWLQNGTKVMVQTQIAQDDGAMVHSARRCGEVVADTRASCLSPAGAKRWCKTK